MVQRNENKKQKFPFIKMLITCLLGAVFIYASSSRVIDINNMKIYHTPFWVAFFTIFLSIIIPIWIAYIRQLKTSNVVYWISVIGAFIPAGMFLIIGVIIYALFTKRDWSQFLRIVSRKNDILKKEKTNLSLNNLPNNKLKIVAASVIFITGLGAYIYNDYNKQKEELSFSIFDLCKNRHYEFINELKQDGLGYEIIKKYDEGWQRKCRCESEAIFASYSSPFNKIKYAKYITKHYDSWKSYYKEVNPEFMRKYRDYRNKCMYKNTSKKIFYKDGKLKIDRYWDDKGIPHDTCYDKQGNKVLFCSSISQID